MSAPEIYQIQELSSPQRDLIKSSVPILEKHGLQLTSEFYTKMLSEYPEVKPFFNETNQKNLRQPRVLAFAVLNYAKNIDDLTPLAAFVNQIIVKHVGLQIKAEHYPIVGKCLIETMGKLLGPQIATKEFVDAWSIAYGNLAQLLINGEYEAYQKQPWQGFKKFRITKIVQESKNVKSIYFTPSDGSQVVPGLRGQYLGFRFSLPNDDIEKSREYSISEYPKENQYRISVKHLENGLVSGHIHQTLKVGDEIKASAPNGNLTYHASENDIIMFAGGIGITPLISILDKAVGIGRNLTLWYSNKSVAERPFGRLLHDLCKKHDNFHLKEFISDEGHRLTKADVNALDWKKPKDVYLLGPSDYMKDVRQMLADKNVADIYSEYFGPTEV